MGKFEHVNRAFEGADEIFPAGTDPDAPGDPRTPQGQGPDEPNPDPAEQLARGCALLPLNDYGNGKRFTAYFGGDCLFVPRVGWFVWDGRVWAQDDDQLEVRRLAQQVSARITHEAQYLSLEDWEIAQLEAGEMARDAAGEIREVSASRRSDSQKAMLRDFEAQIARADDLRKKLAALSRGHHSHAKAAGNSTQINNMMREAQVEVYKPLAALNEDKLMINTQSCVLSFSVGPHPVTGKRTVSMARRDHARELLLTKMMACEYDPAAECPEFERFLETILPSPDLREFVQRLFGYALTGLTTEQKMAFFYGGGRNGKSTLVDLIARMMGAYAATVPIESLAGSEQRKGSDATPDLVRLPGARLVRASEPEKGQKMKEALIKQLTGGEEILVRRMMQEFVEVVPEFTLIIQGNYKPEIRGTDNGIWRRVLLVPFLVQIPDEDVDPLLPQKLWAERNGIFNWLLAGLAKWLDGGLMIPQEVEDATKEYREESDPMLVFLNECCTIDGDPAVFTRSRDLIAAFNWWYVDAGKGDAWGTRTVSNHLLDKAKFFKTPEGHGFTPKKISDTGFAGIRLSDAFLRHRVDAEAEARYATGGDGR